MSHVPYASAVGSIMYVMVYTRPDISHAVRVMSSYMDRPRKIHWQAVKWILRYLIRTSHIGLVYEKVLTSLGKLLVMLILIMHEI